MNYDTATLFITNADSLQQLSIPNFPITNTSRFLKWCEKNKRTTAYERIIVFCELDWNGSYFSQFKGLEVIHKIRFVQELETPIILTSNWPGMCYKGPSGVAVKNVGAFRYLRDPSILFVPFYELQKWTTTDFEEKTPEPLNELKLRDELLKIVYRKDGYISDFFHDLYSDLQLLELDFTKEKGQNFIDEKFKLLCNIYKEFRAELSKVKTEMDAQLENDNIDITYRSVKEYFSFFEPKIRQVINPLQPRRAPEDEEKIEVLIIDDDPLFRERLKGILDKSGFDCFAVKSSTEAIESLKQNDRINVVICDFRFYDDAGRYEREQGSHIIDKIKAFRSKYNFILLTNYDEEYRVEHFQHYNVIQFPKVKTEDQSGRNTLFRIIIEQNQIAATQPDFKDQLFIKYFEKHKAAADFEEVEEQLSVFARNFVMNVKQGIYVPGIANLRGGLQGKKDTTNLRNLRIKLKARRIALGLCQLAEFYHDSNYVLTWTKIYDMLRTGFHGSFSTVDLLPGRYAGDISRLGLTPSIDYHWRNHHNLPLTRHEKIFLLKNGEDFSHR